MRVTRQRKEEHRASLLEAASRLMRANGPENVGVADVTSAAGLTHGAFYGHFASKEAMFAETVASAIAASVERVKNRGTPDRLATLVDVYLRDAQVSDRGKGCPLQTMGADVSRAGADAQRAFARGLQSFLEAVAETPNGSDVTDEVVATVAGLIGAMVMVRAVRDVDKPLANRIVRAAKRNFPIKSAPRRRSTLRAR